jgi:hypothetical protein
MNVAARRARVKRLTELIDGLGKATKAVLADRCNLPLQERNRYLTALYDVKGALHAASSALREALSRQQEGREG